MFDKPTFLRNGLFFLCGRVAAYGKAPFFVARRPRNIWKKSKKCDTIFLFRSLPIAVYFPLYARRLIFAQGRKRHALYLILGPFLDCKLHIGLLRAD